MKKTKFPYSDIVYGILLTVLGVLTIVFAIVNQANVAKMISYSFAVGLFVLALIFILNTIISNVKEVFSTGLFLGSSAVALGIVLVLIPELMPNFFVCFLASLFCVLAVVLLVKGILAICYKEKAKIIVFLFLIAVISGTIGGLMFAYWNSGKTIVYIFIGAMLLLSGIGSLIVGVNKNIKKKEEENKVIENQ